MVEHLEGLLRTLDPDYDKAGQAVDRSKSATTPFVESFWSDMTPRPTHAAQSVMPGTLLDTPHQPSLPVHTMITSPVIEVSQEMPVPMPMPVPALPIEGSNSKSKSKKKREAQKLAEANQQGPNLRMPEATVPSTFEHTAGSKMPEAHVEPQSITAMPTLQPLMSMPTPQIPQSAVMSMPEAVILPPKEAPMSMPEAIIPGNATPMPMPNMTVSNTPIPTIGAVVPPSTYDPDSLPAPTWTATQTPRTVGTSRSIAQKSIYDKITAMLEMLPLADRNVMSKEELADLVMRAIESEGIVDDSEIAGEGRHQRNVNSAFPPFMTNTAYQDQYAMPAAMSDNEWYQVNGGGILPSGWTAHYNYDNGLWYLCNYNDFPPSGTWQDPRGASAVPAMMDAPIAGPLPMPLPMPIPVQVPMTYPTAAPLPPLPPAIPLAPQPAMPVSRQDADWMTSRFGALQAQREIVDDRRGVVAAELQREERESRELQEAIRSSQEAVARANEAIARGDTVKYQSAQEEIIRARGKMDRLTHDAQMRQSMIPSAMMNYQGVNRGFDQSYHPRTYYIDERVSYYPQQEIPPGCANGVPPGFQYPGAMGGATSFSGRIMGKLIKPKLRTSNYMPTAWPVPPGARFKASSTPTPYSMPEFCFAWGMLLRSRRDPYAAAAMRY